MNTKSHVKRKVHNTISKQQSVSEINDEPEEVQIKITNSMSLAPKMVKTNEKYKQTRVKDEAEREQKSGPNKKFKSTIISPDHSRADDIEFMDQEINSEETIGEGEDDMSDTSFVGSEENDCTTPEYIYEELLEDGDVESDVNQGENTDNTEIETMTSMYETVIKGEEEQYSDTLANNEQKKRHIMVTSKNHTSDNIKPQNKSQKSLKIKYPREYAVHPSATFETPEAASDNVEEDECTTPEYLYDELLEDEDVEADTGYQEENAEIEIMSNEEVVYAASSSINKAESKKHVMTTQKNPNPDNTLSAQNKLKDYLKIKPQRKTPIRPPKYLHAPQPASPNKFGARGITLITPRPKTPKINDKFPELPVPTNINQYGDCLKTRLGRYHYGLTLNDPPCQFFQGVLKGASGQTLAAMFGDTNLISKFEGIPMEELGNFAIDTTFRVIPKSTTGVDHVLTISLLFQNQTIPLWFAVTSCSSPELYKRIIIEFQQHVLDWPFTSILLNNDPNLCKAVRALFPDIELYGSWFYYCYSVWKEISLKNLVEKCKTDANLMMAVKLLMVIPYLPPIGDTPSSITMLEGFDVVRNFAEENDLPIEFHRVLDFVATFWFNKVKTKNFTTYGKQTSALNFVEIFQLALLSYMKPNGNVWTLTHSFQNVTRTANTEFNRFLNGKPLVSKKNRAKKLNVPIRQNIKKLLLGAYDVRTYLEKCTSYCEEMLDIFLHPLYPATTTDKTNYIHTEGWRIKIVDK